MEKGRQSVVLVLGEDLFLAREAASRAIAGDYDLSRVQGDRTTVAAILDELRTPSLFGKARIVLVQDASPLLEGDSLDAIAKYAKHPAPRSRLVLVAKKLDGRRKASKALRAAATVVKATPLPDKQVPAWIGQRARDAYGLQVDPRAARALRGRIGEDLGLLDAALVRLRDQIAPRERIEAADIEESTEEHRSPVLFEVANALAAADLPGALAATASGFADGIRIRRDLVTEPQGIALILLSNLHGAYKNLIRFHMAGGDARALAMAPGAAYHLSQKASRHRLKDLVQRHVLFLEADLALKGRGSGANPRRVIEQLLLGVLAPA